MELLVAVLLSIAGLGAGYGVSNYQHKKKAADAENKAEKELAKAKKEADRLIDEARSEAHKVQDAARRDEQNRRNELKDLEDRLVQREAALDKKLDELDKRTEKLRAGEDEVEALKNEIRDIRVKQQEKLEKIAKLGKAEAAEKLMQMTERDIRNDLTGLVAKLQGEAKDMAEDNAAVLIATAMERMSSEVTAERTITTVKLEEIGRAHV